MYKKIFTLLFALCLVGTISTTYSGDKGPVKVVSNGDALRGDTGPLTIAPNTQFVFDTSPIMTPSTTSIHGPGMFNSATVVMSELSTDARSAYDLMSNGVINYLYTEPSNPNNMHACFMTSTDPGPNWSDRNTRYFYSSNGGTNWTYLGTVGATRSGFPCLSATPDGRALLCMHNTDAGGIQNGQLYVDISSGLGVFTRLNPGPHNTALGQIWEVCAGTNSKAFIVGSQNSTAFDSVLVNTTTSLTTASFLGWKTLTTNDNAQNAQCYAIAIGTGKWGIAFNGGDNGAYIVESTDEGVTWSSPTTIFTYNQATDSLGTIRSIDMIYQGANPRVTFGLAKEEPLGAGFYPGLPSKQMFWGPDINGGVPTTIDSRPGLTGTNPINDVFVSCCRGTIGQDAAGNLFVSYSVGRNDTDLAGNNYFDIYLSYSVNNGATWSTGIPLTNLSGQGVLADYRYSAMSPFNTNGVVNIACNRDTVAASNVNGAAPSTSREMFIHVTNLIGIHNVSSEIPKTYALSQNYPNPFNPSTTFKFELPKTGFVSLKVYDVTGKVVATLVNENVNAGSYSYDFNASALASGVYFYSLNAGDFEQTKKMILVK